MATHYSYAFMLFYFSKNGTFISGHTYKKEIATKKSVFRFYSAVCHSIGLLSANPRPPEAKLNKTFKDHHET